MNAPNIAADLAAAYHTFFISIIAVPVIAVLIIGLAAYLAARN